MGGGGRRGPRWGLPPARSKVLGKLGPSFGAGAGCGVGVGVGLIGGVGPGFPGLHLGFGVGVGCGIGIGFGDQIDVLLDELIENTKKLIKATSKEIDKWRRA
ncbi:hypothetical protein SEVIR_3G243700v4 [Setaria viridis]|uniref:Uncharacterized protein n=1 Tax=Setaria viridis TaxID=4556 RepID=A0A4U6VCQ3_SETVI|nr:glycine-rich cell wall structural protein 1-like isoform X3 [Setaria viridis]TKW27220.1 hypothetical protein SEVIR_3G243700v2 [Setaria viridis]